MSNELLRINEIDIFASCMKKLSINPTELNDEEKQYILTTAVVLMKKYSIDHRYISYAELAYFIVLNYSLSFNDYSPLYDFSIAFGLYPISYSITKNSLLTFSNIQNSLLETQIKRKYQKGGMIQTYDQQKIYKIFLESKQKENSFIAPTSYGKSSIIFEHIKKNCYNNKAVIVVPTKALLMQTYQNIKELKLNSKIITHDEMYHPSFSSFIAVLTQERAFRILNKFNISFDYMYIDEAHQLLEKNSRSLLLTRLIKLNRKRNETFQIFYFSPLIANSENITFYQSQSVFEKRINLSIKEPKLFEYRVDGTQYIYNRFVDQFYKLSNKYKNLFSYILKNKNKKNFIYLYTPRKIQQFSKEYIKNLNNKNSEELEKIISNLNKYVHPDFYLIDCIKKGVLYLG